MKKSLLALNVLFIFGLLFSAYTLYNAVVPILAGEVTVEMQDEDEIEWEFSNDTISAHTWVDIINGGNYEIRDTSIHIRIVHNETGIGVLDMEWEIPPIPAGTTHRENIDIEINTNLLPENLKDRLIHEYANFTIYATISAHFMGDGGRLVVNYHNTILWEPILKHFSVDEENISIGYDSGSGDMSIYVPYELSTSSLLSGSARLDVTIYNGTEILSEYHGSVLLGTDFMGTMEFLIDASDTYYLMTHSMNIPIEASLEYAGNTLEDTYDYGWGAPFDALSIGDVSNSLNTVYVDYSFTNHYVRDLELRVDAVVYDSSGNDIGSQTDRYTAYVDAKVERRISVDVSGYPDYALITITEEVSGWHYTIRRDA